MPSASLPPLLGALLPAALVLALPPAPALALPAAQALTPAPPAVWTLPLPPEPPLLDLEVRVIDVGRGLSVLVRGPSGTALLFDAGPSSTAWINVPQALASAGVTSLEHTFASHWHGDHYQGLTVLFQTGWLPTAAAWDRGDWWVPYYPPVTAYLAAAGPLRQEAYPGLTVDLGDGATFELVTVNGDTLCGTLDITSGGSFENAASMAALVRYGDFACYLGGDLTAGGDGGTDVEGFLAPCIGQVEVVVASHHGGLSGLNPLVVDTFDPSLVVVSCGEQPGSELPAPETIAAWNASDAARVVWATGAGDPEQDVRGFSNAQGDIVIRTDGTTFTCGRAAGPELLRFDVFEAPPREVTGVRLAELLTEPLAVGEDEGQWLELVQTAYGAADLGGLAIECEDVDPDSGELEAALRLASRILLAVNERLVVAAHGDPAENGGLFPGLVFPPEEFELEDEGTLVLRAPDDTLLDSVEHGDLEPLTVAGASLERLDLFADGDGPNFAPATTAWSGGDLGTPGQPNGGDASQWPVALAFEPPPTAGGQLALELDSLLDADGLVFFLVSDTRMEPGFEFFSFEVPLDPGALLLTLAFHPQSLAPVDPQGHASAVWPFPLTPQLVGTKLFANAVTLELGENGDPYGVRQSPLVSATIGVGTQP